MDFEFPNSEVRIYDFKNKDKLVHRESYHDGNVYRKDQIVVNIPIETTTTDKIHNKMNLIDECDKYNQNKTSKQSSQSKINNNQKQTNLYDEKKALLERLIKLVPFYSHIGDLISLWPKERLEKRVMEANKWEKHDLEEYDDKQFKDEWGRF
ncbi:unnamed protein product [Brachionus calyciflorus]|uniref:Uncharacterized protein n=1 Tax=Brachionus calyciflorus TaxID=104777 RepID=A0A814CRS2_9BILA|nr:unnamed protein product [Brachionus calyciflorus]